MTSTALIVIDVQEEYFSGSLQIEHPPRDESLANIVSAMAAAATADIPVVVVQHIGPSGEPFDPDSPSGALHPDVAARPRDLLVDKRLPGAFTGTDLEAWLNARDIDHVTIAGYMTNVCCDTTARQAAHMGLGVTLLHDATGVPPMSGVDGSLVPAHQLHQAALAPLKMIGIELLTTAAWSEELVRQSPSVPSGR